MAAPCRRGPRAGGDLDESGRAHTASSESHARLLDWAAADDPGFDLQIFVDMLASLDRLADEDLPVDTRNALALRAYFRDWAAVLAGP
jgi:hypothetical protein